MPCANCKYCREEYSNKYYVCTKKGELLKKDYNSRKQCDNFKLWFK